MVLPQNGSLAANKESENGESVSHRSIPGKSYATTFLQTKH